MKFQIKWNLEILFSYSLLFFITALGLHLRLNILDFRWFTLDEIYQYESSLGNFSEVVKNLWERDVHPPGFHILTYLWVNGTAPYDPVMLKLLPVSLGSLAVVVSFFASKKYWGFVPAILTSSYLAFSPAEIAQSANFRMYSGLILGAALFHWALGLFEDNDKKPLPWVLFVISGFFLTWFHFLGLAYQGFILIVWFYLHRKRLPRSLNIRLFGLFFLIALVPIIFFIHQATNSTTVLSWIPTFSWVFMIRQALSVLIGTYPWSTTPWVLVLLIPLLSLPLFAFYSDSAKKNQILLINIGILFIPLLLMLKSNVGAPVFYWRYTTISLLPFAISLGFFGYLLKNYKWIQWVSCLLISGVLFANSQRFYNFVVKNQWKELITNHEILLRNDFYTCLDLNRRTESQFHFKKNGVSGRAISDLCLKPEDVKTLPKGVRFLFIAEPNILKKHPRIQKSFSEWTEASKYLTYSLYFVKK